MGYRYDNPARLLADFVDHLDVAGHAGVTVDAALAWANRAPTDQATAARLSAVRGFARYLSAYDVGTQVPPTWLVRQNKVRPTPYIYSAGEIAGLMVAANRLSPPIWAATMATLMGLMAATGLRPGEVYRLAAGDIDLDHGRLDVMHSKHGKSRQIPLHPSTVDALRRYGQFRDHTFAALPGSRFFVDAGGSALTSEAVTSTFNRLVTAAGIESPDHNRHPRLGSLRHTFAVSTLLAWHQSGMDVQRHLPVLSAFLGHNEPAATYWYLEATPELMALVASRLERAWQARS